MPATASAAAVPRRAARGALPAATRRRGRPGTEAGVQARGEPRQRARAGDTPERVAEAITRGLLRREYAVGQRLVEADLTARLGVGRSTVREALKILASKGVVQIVPHRGAEIRGLTLADARDLLAVLEVLAGLAARLAAERIGIGRNKALFRAAARALIEPRGSDELDGILDQRARFYQSMFDVAGNAELERAMPTWRAHLFRTQFYGVLTRADLKALVAEYRGITEAILAGDARSAEQRTRSHLRKTAQRTLRHLQ